MRSLTITLALAATLLASGCGTSAPTPSAPGSVSGFSLVGLDGVRHTVADYRGKVVIVNFWATWCIPCRAEIPDLEHEYRSHRDNVVVLGIDWKESRDTVASFMTEIGATYPVLLDSDGATYSAFEVSALPSTFVLNRAGKLVKSRLGIASRDTLEAEIQQALKS